MSRPRCFVGSSREALVVAQAVQEALEHDAEVTVWNQDVFELSDFAIESLLDILRKVDYGIFVFAPDDILRIRGNEQPAARDNVILELGLSIGILGRRRSFLLVPKSDPDLRIPTDLIGLTPAVYDNSRSDGNLVAGVSIPCNKIRRIMQRMGRFRLSALPEVEDPRGAVMDGMTSLVSLVAASYGPLGRTVSIDEDTGQSFTRSGVRIASGATGSDRFGRQGIEVLARAAREASREIVDGTKLTVLIAGRLIQDANSAIETGFQVDDVLSGMRDAIAQAGANLLGQSVAVDQQSLLGVAVTSAVEEEIASAVFDATEKAGPEGIITVEIATDREDVRAELSEGMSFDRGFLHPDFDNGPSAGAMSHPDCLIALFDGRISYANDVVPLLQQVKAAGAPLLLVADDIDSQALQTLTVNHREGVVRCVAVRAPGYGDRRELILRDIAAFTGAKVVEHALGRSIAHIRPGDLGKASLVRVTRDQTTLVGGGGTPQDIERRAAEIRAEVEDASDDFAREKAQERLGRLRGRIVTLHVGGRTSALRSERRELTINAMFAVQEALRSGIVPGGGVALMKARSTIDPSAELAAARRSGARAVVRALEEPLRVLARSAGHDEAQSISIAERGLADNFGINVRNRQIEDLVRAQVVDPTSVVRRALEIAFETARVVLTTETWESAQPANEDNSGTVD